MSELKISGIASTAFGDVPVFVGKALTGKHVRRVSGFVSGKEGWGLLVGLLAL